MFGTMPLVPAYGRDYKSKKEVMEAWNNGKDFVSPNGRYANQDSFPPGETITIRYQKMTKVMIFKNLQKE